MNKCPVIDMWSLLEIVIFVSISIYCFLLIKNVYKSDKTKNKSLLKTGLRLIFYGGLLLCVLFTESYRLNFIKYISQIPCFLNYYINEMIVVELILLFIKPFQWIISIIFVGIGSNIINHVIMSNNKNNSWHPI